MNVGLDAMLIFHFSSLEKSSLCIVEPKAAPIAIPKAIPSPKLSITAPRIIPKTTPNAAPNAILLFFPADVKGSILNFK